MNIKKQIDEFNSIYSYKEETSDSVRINSITIGLVVNTDDPLQMGRLQVFCPSLNDNPKKIHHYPWCVYATSFGGVIDNSSFLRGSDAGNNATTGAVHYGQWNIPEQGAHVLVGCIDGDPRRRFWFACVNEHQATHTLGHGRYKWSAEDGTPDGPLSSNETPIEPLYSNMTKAFVDRNSREWKSRGADYQITSNRKDEQQIPNSEKQTYVDEVYEDISNAEQDDWVKGILGAHGYDWSSFKNISGFMSSKVYGITTPGFHAITLDDRPYNSRIKLRTSSGHQILLDDTNERIYINTFEGNSWIEMDKSGNIDVYAKRRLSFHSEKDFNISTDETFRVKATKGIHLYAGDNRGQPPLSEIPPDGQIRLHSTDDIHIKSENNINVKADDEFNVYAKSTHLESEDDIILNSDKIQITDGYSMVEVSASNVRLQSAGDIEWKTDEFSSTMDTLENKINTDISTFNLAMGQIEAQTSASNLPRKDDYEDSSLGAITAIEFDFLVEKAIWTNRVPQHEPWPRTLMQDSDDIINEQNDGYKNNVDWIEQFDNETSPEGLEPIGKVEGDEEIYRGINWRR